MWHEDDLIYAAGFMDGEGCFSFKQGRTQVICENTNKPVIEWFANTFGGKVRKRVPKNPKHRNTFRWALYDTGALEFCSAIVPHLKQKTEEALLLMLLQYTKQGTQGKKLSEETKLERQRLSDWMKGYKHVEWA